MRKARRSAAQGLAAIGVESELQQGIKGARIQPCGDEFAEVEVVRGTAVQPFPDRSAACQRKHRFVSDGVAERTGGPGLVALAAADRPLAALQGLAPDGNVVFAGSFSKMLFPSLRLGYLVLPRHLVDPMLAARSLTDRYGPMVEQAVVFA